MDACARWTRARGPAGLAVSLVVLAGCAPTVNLTARPTDSRTAEALAHRVADAGRCNSSSFEYYSNGSDFWTFTCQDGPHTFLVTAVASEGAREREARTLQLRAGAAGVPVRGGDFYLVSEALRTADGGKSSDLVPGDPRALDRFPGTAIGPAV